MIVVNVFHIYSNCNPVLLGEKSWSMVVMVILVEVDTVTGRRIATTTTLTPPGMGEPTEGMENPKTRASAVMELV